MVGQGRMLKFGAAALTFTILTAVCATRTMKPIIEEKYSAPPAKVLFISADNFKQPNKVVIETTPEVVKWMKENGFWNVGQKNVRGTLEALNRKLHERRLPDDGEAVFAYAEELQKRPRNITVPADFLSLTAPACLELSDFFSSVANAYGIKTRIFVVETVRDRETFNRHYFVVASVDGKQLIFDPFYGVSMDADFAAYRKFYGKISVKKPIQGAKIRTYPLLDYSQEYDELLKGPEEQLDILFEGIKNN